MKVPVMRTEKDVARFIHRAELAIEEARRTAFLINGRPPEIRTVRVPPTKVRAHMRDCYTCLRLV